MKEKVAKHGLLVFIIFTAIIKLVMVSNLPIYAISPAAVDDRLMVDTATNLLNRSWLGGYHQFTLVKGMFFPFFLAVLNKIGISYTSGTALLYIVAVILFIYSIKDKINQKFALGFIYIVLLFNPVTYGLGTFQRVYRNSITPAQVLIIIGGFMAIYFHINEKIKSLWLWAIGAGIGLAAFWHTREDAIWILPFVIFITVLNIIKSFLKYKQENRYKEMMKRFAITFIPFIILFLSITIISAMNYEYYGIYTTNELNNSNFTDAIKSIYAVKPEEKIQYVSVTREKLERIYQYSPTMYELKDHLNNGIDVYKSADRHPDDDELENGWFFWALRYAVAEAGYYEKGAQAVNEVYAKISAEIEQAFEEGNLQKQPVMPSALMAPWEEGYAKQLTVATVDAIWYVISYEGITATAITSMGDGAGGIYLFESITNNKAIYPDQDFQYYEVSVADRYAGRLNKITKLYHYTGFIFAALGTIAFICFVIKTIKDIKKKEYRELDILILLMGLIGSFMMLAVGVAYNHISSCNSITYMYLSGAYPLTIAFECISICKLFELIRNSYAAKRLLRQKGS